MKERKDLDRPAHNTIEIDCNTEKSAEEGVFKTTAPLKKILKNLGDLRRLVSQASVKNHLLKTGGKLAYVSRKEGGRGLASIEDSVDASIQRFENYIQKHDGRLITAIRNDNDNTMDNRMTITRKQNWEGKQLYGRFKQLISNISHDQTWT